MGQIELADIYLPLDSCGGVDVGKGFFGAHELGFPVAWDNVDHVEHLWGQHSNRPILDEKSDFGRIEFWPVEVERD